MKHSRRVMSAGSTENKASPASSKAHVTRALNRRCLRWQLNKHVLMIMRPTNPRSRESCCIEKKVLSRRTSVSIFKRSIVPPKCKRARRRGMAQVAEVVCCEKRDFCWGSGEEIVAERRRLNTWKRSEILSRDQWMALVAREWGRTHLVGDICVKFWVERHAEDFLASKTGTEKEEDGIDSFTGIKIIQRVERSCKKAWQSIRALS